jgi:hypothetical protein
MPMSPDTRKKQSVTFANRRSTANLETLSFKNFYAMDRRGQFENAA